MQKSALVNFPFSFLWIFIYKKKLKNNLKDRDFLLSGDYGIGFDLFSTKIPMKFWFIFFKFMLIFINFLLTSI